jgi:hypothetical protein
MKKVCIIMAALFIFPRLLVAQGFDVDQLLGKSWYGLYIGGQKAGYAFQETKRGEENTIIVIENAAFKISMGTVPQDMQIFSERTYGADGALLRIVSKVVDLVSTTSFFVEIREGQLWLRSVAGGVEKEEKLPKPAESLKDALKHSQWIQGEPKVGDALSFSVFEPIYKKEIMGKSTIEGIEWRTLGGARTRVYKISTTVDVMPLESISYVTETGETLEDVTGGMIVMRLESEENAKDVDYSNDVIVSNAAMVDSPIANPREREQVQLILRGPLSEDHLFNDDRQYFEAQGDGFIFVGSRQVMGDFATVPVPITEESVLEWLKPTTFVQSDDPGLVAKAQEIVEGATDSWEINQRLCSWVYDNMKTAFSARLTNAVEVLGNMEGDCTEHSILFIGLARAAGLPAREVAGLIYVGDQPGFYFHQWAKVWVGKWVDVDPTFDQPLADATHIKLAEGDLMEQAKLIPVIGRIRIEVVPDRKAQSAP